jgi:hypothetical protein
MIVLERVSSNLPDESISNRIIISERNGIIQENVTPILREWTTIDALSLRCDTAQEDRDVRRPLDG